MTVPALNTTVLEKAGVAVSTVALTFNDPDVSYETLAELGLFIGTLADAGAWWQGDFLNACERLRPDEFSQLAEMLGLAPQTLLNRKSIASVVPERDRKPGLKFSHHAEVAYKPRAERQRWLNLALKEGWSRARLRDEVIASENEGVLPARPEQNEPAVGQVAVEIVRRAKESGDPAWWLVPRELVIQLRNAVGEEE